MQYYCIHALNSCYLWMMCDKVYGILLPQIRVNSIEKIVFLIHIKVKIKCIYPKDLIKCANKLTKTLRLLNFIYVYN